MTLEQLFPERRELEVTQAYDGLGLEGLAPPGRPYVIANMVSTADGRATLTGRTAQISSEADRELFLELRTEVDAVMVGTGTIAIEGYGPLIRSDERRQRRENRGLAPVPTAITATRTMELPVQTPLFQDPASRIIVLTNSPRDAPPALATLTVERLTGPELDLAAGMERLREAHGIRSILLEGGPTLLAAMVGAGAVDELFLTIAAKIAGSAGEPTILEGSPLPEPVSLRLLSVIRDDSYLFLRYGLGIRGPE